MKTALEGKTIKYCGIRYAASPEIVHKGCKGCDLMNQNQDGCPKDLTDLCRKGCIFKKI